MEIKWILKCSEIYSG